MRKIHRSVCAFVLIKNMRTEKDIRKIAKEMNPSVYISFDISYSDRTYTILAIRKNTHYSFSVPNLDSPEVEKGLERVMKYFAEEETV